MSDEQQTNVRLKPYPSWICHECGVKHGRKTENITATWHIGTCGVCECTTHVTEPRDFGHLKEGWQTNE